MKRIEKFDLFLFLITRKIKQYLIRSNQNENTKILAIGGGGCNIATHVISKLPTYYELLSINSDANALNSKDVNHKLYLHSNTKGCGCGGDESCGYQAITKTVIQNILSFIGNQKQIIIIASLGGGTGTGSTKAIVKYLTFLGFEVHLIVTTPFLWEGAKRVQVATNALAYLKNNTFSVSVLDNQEIVKANKDEDYKSSLQSIDEKALKLVLEIG